MKSELIRNRDRARQLMAFDGMQYGRCKPTDIDLSMDWQQKFFVFVELKGVGQPLTVGQRIHLEGLVDAIEAGGRKAVAILAEHNTPDTEADVHAAQSKVVAMYDGHQWVKEIPSKTLDSLLVELHAAHNQTQREQDNG